MDKIKSLERRIEEDYISRLQSQCFRERQYSKYNKIVEVVISCLCLGRCRLFPFRKRSSPFLTVDANSIWNARTRFNEFL